MRSTTRRGRRPVSGAAVRHPQHRARSAQRAREAYEQFRLAQEALGIVTWIWDPATERTQWYGDAAPLLGLAPGKFSGRFNDYLKRVHPDDSFRARQVYVDCLKGRQPEYRSIDRVVWPDGSIRWLETYGRADYGPDGRALRMTGVIKDITPRKQEESARLKAEKQLARFFDASPEYIVVVRFDDGLFIAANPAFERVTGYRQEDLLGRTVEQLGIWALPGERKRFLAELAPTGRLRDRPVQLRTRDGRVVHGVMWSSVVEHDGEKLIISLMRDLTEEQRLEQLAAQSERKFTALFETNPVAMAVTRGPERRVVDINNACVALFGLTREQAIGRRTDDLSESGDPGQLAAMRARIDSGATVTGMPMRWRRRDGTQIEVLQSARRVEIDGEAHVVNSMFDMTEQRRIERRVRQSERKFSTLFETSPVATIVARPKEQLVEEINDAALALLGLTREQAVGHPTRALVRDMDWWRFDTLRAKLLEGGSLARVPISVERLDGKPLELLLSASTFEIEGEPHIVAALLDMTEERRIERERRQAEARYSAMFENSPEPVSITRLSDGQLLAVNDAWVREVGHARDEALGRSAVELGIAGAGLAAELEASVRGEGRTVNRLVQFTRPDGSVREVMISGARITIGDQECAVWQSRDMTAIERERRRHETLLMNVARGVSAELGGAFFRSLVEHLARELGADFAFVGEVVAPDNQRVRTLACVSDGAIVENFEYALESAPCLHAMQKRGTVLFTQGVAELFPRDGGLKTRGVQAYVGTSLHAADGGPLGVLAVMHRQPVERGVFWASMIEIFGARAAAEIERARAEAKVRETNASLEAVVRERTAQLEEANRDLASYNYSISHDLRQPLGVISGFAELLRGAGVDAAKAEEYLREIEHNAARMEEMIAALLALSNAGRDALHSGEVDMRGVVEAVLHDFAAAGRPAARIEVGELPAALGDTVLLRQVWANLIGNAVKYSAGGAAPCIEIRGARLQVGGRGEVEYLVRDNGVGFDMRDAGRLFEAFQRLPSANGFGGSGIGLAIVQRILRRHGGDIRAESAPGLGATFRFTLPG